MVAKVAAHFMPLGNGESQFDRMCQSGYTLCFFVDEHE